MVKRGIVLVLALGVGMACTSARGTKELQVKSWAASGVAFSSLKVFSWKPGSDGGLVKSSSDTYRPLVDRVREAIIGELEGRGYRLADSGVPDFWVSFQVAMTSARRVVPGSRESGSMNPHPLGSSYVRTGFLMISIGLPGHTDPVWTGSASGQSPRLLLRHMQIRETVHRILTQFPPL